MVRIMQCYVILCTHPASRSYRVHREARGSAKFKDEIILPIKIDDCCVDYTDSTVMFQRLNVTNLNYS